MARQDVEGSNVVITGIITVNFHEAYALIYLGSTNSDVSPSFVVSSERQVKTLNVSYMVMMPIDTTYRNCVISVQGKDIIVALKELSLSNFDVIMGMD